jgi:ribosomal 50S subunit-recycling heat shock protein
MFLIFAFLLLPSPMRLDIFLKSSRLILRRSLAQKFCDANLVKVNGQIAKSSKEIKQNDEIDIKRGSRLTKVRVLEIPNKKQISRVEAANLYEIVSEEILADEI